MKAYDLALALTLRVPYHILEGVIYLLGKGPY